jgi:hypothetical protein
MVDDGLRHLALDDGHVYVAHVPVTPEPDESVALYSPPVAAATESEPRYMTLALATTNWPRLGTVSPDIASLYVLEVDSGSAGAL